MLFSHGPNKAFQFSGKQVPDSCRVTERNGNSIRACITDGTIENVFSFRQFGSCLGLFDITGLKHNIRTL